MRHGISRRDFIRTTALFSAIGVAPQFLTRTVEAAGTPIAGFKDDRVLVVVQLGGGNDGINTLVPHGDDAYYRLRPKLGLKNDKILKIDDYVALNSRCSDLMRMYEDGRVAIVQGVGYPNPDRSHFRSMEIWETASSSDEYMSSGWIGRYFDHHCSGTAARPQAGVAVMNERPQAFDGKSGLGISFENPERFGWQPGKGADTEANFAKLNAPTGSGDSNLDFLRHVTSNAILSSKEIRAAAERAKLEYTSSKPLDRSLDTVAALIRGNLDTRIYYVSAGGFDTHASQSGKHDNLLGQVSEGLKRFHDRLRNDGTSDRVVTMVFSEFGRRVQENYSAGTDHGTAAPMFIIGDPVKPGLYGKYPSLSDLDDGDLKHNVDFRSAYATLLDRWFEVDSASLLGGKFETLPLLG